MASCFTLGRPHHAANGVVTFIERNIKSHQERQELYSANHHHHQVSNAIAINTLSSLEKGKKQKRNRLCLWGQDNTVSRPDRRTDE